MTGYDLLLLLMAAVKVNIYFFFFLNDECSVKRLSLCRKYILVPSFHDLLAIVNDVRTNGWFCRGIWPGNRLQCCDGRGLQDAAENPDLWPESNEIIIYSMKFGHCWHLLLCVFVVKGGIIGKSINNKVLEKKNIIQ